MANKTDLLKYTTQFFDLHWGLDVDRPEWDFSWDWNGAVPNYLLGGVYALFNGDNLLYIGLGSSRGGGIYKDRGISRRLMSHVYLRTPNTETGYMPRERWEKLGVNKVATIGFQQELNYLAPALEDYLIGKLNPEENSMKRSKKI